MPAGKVAQRHRGELEDARARLARREGLLFTQQELLLAAYDELSAHCLADRMGGNDHYRTRADVLTSKTMKLSAEVRRLTQKG